LHYKRNINFNDLLFNLFTMLLFYYLFILYYYYYISIVILLYYYVIQYVRMVNFVSNQMYFSYLGFIFYFILFFEKLV